MSRRLSFRAWSEQDRNFYYFGLPDKGAETTARELEHRSIQQFTGLIDKNGKEIYEGDIVLHSNSNRYEVKHGDFSTNVNQFEYRENHYGYHIGSDEEFSDVEQVWNADWVEVIGNIYENDQV